jgi:hypothetical protein
MEKQISDADDVFLTFIFLIILSLILITISFCFPSPKSNKQDNKALILSSNNGTNEECVGIAKTLLNDQND